MTAVANQQVTQEDIDNWVRDYAFDPVRFVREVLGVEPDEFQIRVLEAYGRGERRISIVSGHGVGKTTVLAWCIVHHITFRLPQKTVCTAPTSGQLFDALASETKVWLDRLPAVPRSWFDVKSDRIVRIGYEDESFVAFKTSRAEQPEALAGVHSESVLLIGDEASGIPEAIFEAASGSMSGHTATTILAGNPVRTSGTFFDTHHKLRDVWYTVQISCVGHPRVSKDFIEDMRLRYGEESNAYRVRVLGEFPKADDDTVIPFELMENALRRDVAPTRNTVIWGVDVARTGADKSVLVRRKGNVLTQKSEWRAGYDTMQVVAWVKNEYDFASKEDKPEVICVDVIGLGAGVVDRLRELGLPVRGINVSESPAMKERYLNLRAELWFKAREWLAKRDCNIANDETLGADLVAPKYKITTTGKLQVESKDDLRKRIGRSPDFADAFILTFAAEAAVASGASSGQSWKKPIRRNIPGIA